MVKNIPKRKLEKSITNYTIAIVITLVLGGYLTYANYSEYSATNKAYENGQVKIAELQANLTTLNREYNEKKKNFDTENATLSASLQKIFPPVENYTNLARELDNYFLSNNSPNNPLFLSDLRFSPARMNDKKDYATLPFNMTVSATEKSFKNFLQYINSSGDLNNGNRLMDISSISINFENNQNSNVNLGNSEPLISVSMAMNAYFQKPNGQ